MARTLLTIPNIMSGARIVLVPVLLLLAWLGRPGLYLGILAISLGTDFLDGFLARQLNQTSELGAKLDSWGDLLTYTTMVVALSWLWPGIFWHEFWFLVLGVTFFLLATVTSLFKFRDLPRYHTWAAKLSALMMAPAYYLLTLWDLSLPFRVVVVFHIYVSIEEILITLTLRRKRYDVPSLIHARTLTKRARERLLLHRERARERRELRRERLSRRYDRRD